MEHTKLLLAEWGRWARQWGFTLDVKPAADVLGCGGSDFPPVLYSDEVMEQVGQAVAALRKNNFLYYEIVNDRFRSNKSLRKLAAKYQISFREARDTLAAAIRAVDSELAALDMAA